MSSSDEELDAVLELPELGRTHSQVQVYENLFGNLNVPLQRTHSLMSDILEEESEIQSLQMEINESVNFVQKEIKQVEDKFKGQEEKLSSAKQGVREKFKKKKQDLLKKINNAKTRRQFDKITFYLALIMIQYKSFVLGMNPDNGVYILNLILLVLLLIWRNITYRLDNSHYYMMEFCYFANVILYTFIFFFPENRTLYLACFAFCCGPVGWALALVGCSFVIHNVNQLTSIFIHFTPMVLMMNLHWRTQYNEDRGWKLYDAKKDEFGWEFIKDYYKSAITVYLVWAVLYYLLVYVILKNRITERNYTTLANYHINKNSSVGKFIMKLGPNYQGLMYVGSHFLSVMVIFTVTLASYFNMWVNIVIMFLASSVSIWNGATFYMEYFSKKYEINLKKLEETEVDTDKSKSKKE
ncbi:unnamed protein product [Moneuplotes crassus]|uniref:Glycerophosphocholine acyltransferase 1 n=1 Tax=Euplotes crassus TaxID=5936 RepID=A0AAD1UNW0_EUPCR|nr:unnamed protein product [Moneuplotes crassus]